MDFKQQIIEQLAILTELEPEKVAGSVEIPPNPEMGDLAFPCFPLAKVLRKAPPMIAKELSEKFPKLDFVEKIDVAGGYLNFFFSRSSFVNEELTEVFAKGENYGKSDEGKGKTVLVEFSSPNIAKPFHIGHLFSTAVGNSLDKIYSFLGYDTVKINHLGDWGTQFGKLISAYKRWGNPEVIEKDPINELLKLYVHFHEVAKEQPELDDEAREYFRLLEAGDEDTTSLWKYFREVSLVEFKRVYDMLNISFDSYNGESFYSDKMDEVVDILKEKELLVESEGAMVVDLSKEDMPPCMILKSNGTTIYDTRAIAAALYLP
ncbi:MAG: arginine--tRNA ligase, partial [Clostridia bacterium]|nr:arginine--tRNA ligase [Clostridia bacterium]